MRVLDAGCGRGRQLALPEGAYVVGIDASREALALNTSIDEAICGDIETYPLPRESFDLILALDVLELLPNPEVALASFA
jgi:SAM-dependent methyltransferase